MAVGRISGPLLKDNLLRNGVNLAFETSLLYLDVMNGRIGINTATPTNDLQVVGTTRTTNLEVTNTTTIASFTISSDTISSNNNTIFLTPANGGVVYQGTIYTGNITVANNSISTNGTSVDLNLSPTGQTTINSSVLVNGDLHATGTITADGNIQLGNQSTDQINFAGQVDSDIIPNNGPLGTPVYNLGSPTAQWANVYSANLNTTNITTTNLTATDLKTSQLDISGNTIGTISSNTNINFNTTGTGGVNLGNFKFYNNTITNTVANSVSIFAETGSGYVKFSGTTGVVIPSGNNSSDRPLPGHLETGMIRFNTNDQYIEVYNGTTWVDSAGSGGVSYSSATNLGILSALIFG